MRRPESICQTVFDGRNSRIISDLHLILSSGPPCMPDGRWTLTCCLSISQQPDHRGARTHVRSNQPDPSDSLTTVFDDKRKRFRGVHAEGTGELRVVLPRALPPSPAAGGRPRPSVARFLRLMVVDDHAFVPSPERCHVSVTNHRSLHCGSRVLRSVGLSVCLSMGGEGEGSRGREAGWRCERT